MTDNLKYDLGLFKILQKKLFEENREATSKEVELMVELIHQLEDELLYVESFLNR